MDCNVKGCGFELLRCKSRLVLFCPVHDSMGCRNHAEEACPHAVAD